MKTSLKDFFPVINPFISDKIISQNSLNEISDISEFLPGIPVLDSAGFECRLSEKQQNTDLLVVFTKKGRHNLFSSFDSLPELTTSSVPWKRVNTLMKKWMDKDSIVYENLDNMWLEFDTGEKNNDYPEPSLFFAPSPVNIGDCKSSSSFELHEWMIEEVLNPLLGGGISGETREKISQCFDLLPATGKVFQVGVMLPRAAECKAVRLCIQGIEALDIVPYLESIGWVDPTEGLKETLQELSDFVDSFAFNISIENTVHPKIGIECYIHQEPGFMSKWSILLDFMCRKDVCTKDKMSSILKWPGYVEEKSCPDLWPSNFSQGSTFVYPELRSTAARAINHVKVVYQPMTPLQAKVYLWFGHRWISTDGTIQDL
jgi:hypothetical protein